MAKIVEDIIILRISKLVKDHETDGDFVSDVLRGILEDAAQNVVPDNIIVEIERKNK